MKYLFIVIAGLSSMFLQAKDVKLAWDANPESNNVARYTVNYKAFDEGSYSSVMVVHPAVTVTIPNLQEGTLYSFKVNATNISGVDGEFSPEIFYQIPVTQDPIVSMERATWTASASSASAEAVRATDDDPNTYWESEANVSLPQSFVVDLGAVSTITGIGYLPLQHPTDDLQVGRIRNFIIQTSENGIDWSQAAQGEFSNNEQEKLVSFPARNAKFVKLIATSDWLNGSDGKAVIAEFKVVGEYITAPEAPKNLRIVK